MERKLIITQDGSHSIYVPELNEHYHSTFGAIQESTHVFIENGLKEILKSKIDIEVFEMGFGTGLNTYLTFLFSLNHPLDIHYTAIETYPVADDLLNKLNYEEIIETWSPQGGFIRIHEGPWEQWNKLTKNFQFKKHEISLLEYSTDEKFDLVYFDAFAPNVQPELWSAAVFEKIYAMMNVGGILVTYCCKGEVKRNMKAAGFTLEKLPGPPGKREILRARKLHTA